MKYFTSDHEWLTLENGVATIGITQHAATTLGDIVFLEVKPAGTSLKRGDAAAVIESVKAASEVYAPVSGETLEVNNNAAGNPALINDDPEGRGWLFKIRLSDQSELNGLLDQKSYEALTGNS